MRIPALIAVLATTTSLTLAAPTHSRPQRKDIPAFDPEPWNNQHPNPPPPTNCSTNNTTHAPKPIYWILTGDSTVAAKTGYGDSFLDTTLAPGSAGTNHAFGGAGTKSFRSSKAWDKVLADVEKRKKESKWGEVGVLIQFGHNDQKESANTTVGEYKENLGRFGEEVRGLGGVPYFVTPITRRNFNHTTNSVIPELAVQRTAMISVCKAHNFKVADLNRVSEKYINAIGEKEAKRFNFKKGDWSHVNGFGAKVHARIVSDVLVEAFREVKGWTREDEKLSRVIREGKSAWGLIGEGKEGEEEGNGQE